MKYRLKAGSAMEAGKKYNWKDPSCNICESDRNLAAESPEKWERIEEHLYDYDQLQTQRPQGAPQPNAIPPSASPSQVTSATMPRLDATTAKQVDRAGKTIEERYGGLDSLGLQELKEIAEAEEVPLPKPVAKSGLTKEEVLKTLKAAK